MYVCKWYYTKNEVHCTNYKNFIFIMYLCMYVCMYCTCIMYIMNTRVRSIKVMYTTPIRRGSSFKSPLCTIFRTWISREHFYRLNLRHSKSFGCRVCWKWIVFISVRLACSCWQHTLGSSLESKCGRRKMFPKQL